MAVYLSPAQGATELITRIDGALKALASEMRAHAGSIRVDAIWEIPLREAPLVDKDSQIIPIAHSGIEAKNLAIECLTSIWLRIGQNMRETLRAPGVVGLPGVLIEQVREVNKLRLELYFLLKTLSAQDRVKIWRSKSNLSALQTTRLTHVIENPKAIRFYWEKTPSMRRKNAHALAAEYSKELIDIHGHDPVVESLPEDSHDLKLARGRDLLLVLPSDELVAIYRPGQPHVRAKIRLAEGKPYIDPTSVPFVYDVERYEPPVIRHLKAFDPSAKANAPRSPRAKVEVEPYIPSLYIHQYVEAHRKPVKPKSGSSEKQEPHVRHQRNKME
jgi:hypothetical protein